MKKSMLLTIFMIILLVGCSNNENNAQKDNMQEEQTVELQAKVELSEEEIKSKLINGKWLITAVRDLNGRQSEITQLDLFGLIYKHLDGIKFYEDGTFTNNIGIAVDVEEDNFKGVYNIEKDKIILKYNTDKTEILDIIQTENKISLTIKNLFDYFAEDYIVYYNKFNFDEDYNDEKIHSEENFLKESSGEKIFNNVSVSNIGKKLKTKYLKDFLLLVMILYLKV